MLRKGKLKGIRTVATEVFPVQFRNAPNGNVAYVDFVMGTVNELVYSPNKAPNAVASATPQAFCPPVPATRSASQPPARPIPRATRSPTPGTSATAARSSPARRVVHTYPPVPDPGIYTATVRVSDGGSTSTATVKVFAGDCPPSVTILSPTAGDTSQAAARSR